MLQVIPMNTLDRKGWSSLYTLYTDIFQESYPYRELPDREVFLKSPQPINAMTSGIEGIILMEGERMIACAHFRIQEDKSICTSEVKFLQKAFHPHSAEAIKDRLVRICKERKINVLQMVAEHESVRNYYIDRGEFKKVGQVRESFLDITTVDWSLVSRWQKMPTGFNLQIVDFNKESELDEIVRLYNETMKDVPYQEAEGVRRIHDRKFFKDILSNLANQGSHMLAYLLYAQDKAIGVATFDGIIEQPKSFLVGYLATSQEYRRQALAKAVKALTLIDLKHRYPSFRYIVTGNEETNMPILRINQALGFRAASEYTMLRYLGSL